MDTRFLEDDALITPLPVAAGEDEEGADWDDDAEEEKSDDDGSGEELDDDGLDSGDEEADQ